MSDESRSAGGELDLASQVELITFVGALVEVLVSHGDLQRQMIKAVRQNNNRDQARLRPLLVESEAHKEVMLSQFRELTDDVGAELSEW